PSSFFPYTTLFRSHGGKQAVAVFQAGKLLLIAIQRHLRAFLLAWLNDGLYIMQWIVHLDARRVAALQPGGAIAESRHDSIEQDLHARVSGCVQRVLCASTMLQRVQEAAQGR